MSKTCDHDLCPAERCHYARPRTIDQSACEPSLWAIETSGVRVGQRYQAFQRHLGPCRIMALGLSTDGPDHAMVAFENENTRITYFTRLKDFTGMIAGHQRWELLPPCTPHSSDGEPIVDRVVHVLHAGAAVGGCFPGQVPRAWPGGHTWVGIADIDEATCTPCVAAAKAKDHT